MLLLEQAVPLPLVEVGTFSAAATGVLLLVLARGLSKGYRAALRATVIILVAAAIAAILKGFDYEEAIILGAVALLAEVWVEADPLEAGEMLLRYLSGCQRELRRAPGAGAPGDVAFVATGSGGEIALVSFVRANVAAVVRSVGIGGPKAGAGAVAQTLRLTPYKTKRLPS